MREVPQKAVDFISAHEGLSLKAYHDGGGVLTIGYGHTGPEIQDGDIWTKVQADTRLLSDINNTASEIGAMLDRDVIDSLTDNQYSAIISFTFNLGTHDSKGKPWTLWSVINKRQYDQVPAQLVRFVYDNGTKVQGLVNRRNDEIALWSTDEPGSTNSPPSSSSSLRDANTPPAPIDPVPMHQDKGLIAQAGGLVIMGASGIGELSKTVSPYAASSHVVAHAVETLALASAVLAAAGLAYNVYKKRQSTK